MSKRVPVLSRLEDFAVRDEIGRRGELAWAFGLVVAVAILVAVTSFFYLKPPGRVQYHAVMSESGGITSGTEVRVAGIPVGKVSDVTLGDGHVDVTLDVESSVFVGDQTSMQVRMLTVVGGTYVALLPSGGTPLGDTPIPAQRVSIPYSTGEVLDSAASTVGRIDALTLRGTAVATTRSLDAAPGAVRGILTNAADITALLDEQQRQIQSIADLGGEYTTALVAQRDTLIEMIRRIRSVLPLIIGYKDRGILTYDALAEMVLYVGDIFGDPYQKRIKPPLHKLAAMAGQTNEMSRRMAEAIRQLRTMADQLSRIVTPHGVSLDFGDSVVDDSVICIPIAGRTC
ncbi:MULTISPECIES: MlaD family protein [unclassified Gordonia (in: high G+C Gram-positive bacteria)]|uniref:MlaD family protein n=1 Tax=unclassified Gordonia (in: high G+C Gram-positive bacteria) TaxID=2657482 RepID=UPI001F0FC874|nr:MlaD family protein [Gordonia sp. ABSL49_1]MCH5644965.1 MlaD family protein [Gordonia sp. ABSL49_1]